MTLREDISMDDLEIGSLWKGHHTKYVYRLLSWDGDFNNGGMAFVKRTKKTDHYYEYKVINIVDLLRAYDKLPSVPEVGQTWENAYGAKWVVRYLLTDDMDSPWVAYSEEGVMHVDEYTTMELVNFLTTFKRVA